MNFIPISKFHLKLPIFLLLEASSVENLELIRLFYTHVGDLVGLQLICHENQWCGRGQPWFRAYHMDTENFRFLGTQLVSCKDTEWKEMWKIDFVKMTFPFWKIDFIFIKNICIEHSLCNRYSSKHRGHVSEKRQSSWPCEVYFLVGRNG